MAQRFPLFIGVTGKRKFDKDDADNDRKIAHCVAQKFAAIFRRLDRDYPNTPKIVLTGLAFGTDLIAAQVAFDIGSPDWAVAAVLPFDRALFEQDFVAPADETGKGWPARYIEHACGFRGMADLADPRRDPHPRVIVRELPKLMIRGTAASAEQLSRDSGRYDAALRRNHYEQVGQFIAETATVLIGVMPADEKPTTDQADGGTARILACRRAGRPDALGQEVASRSAILRAAWPELVHPPGGYVWLIEPKADGFEAANDPGTRLPVTVLPPLLDRPVEAVYAGRPGHDIPAEDEQHVHPVFEFSQYVATARRRERQDKARLLRASLALARGFEQFNTLTMRLLPADRRADISDVPDIVAEVEESRRITSKHQGSSNTSSMRVFKALAILFVVAIASFETFAKFFPEKWAFLAIYIAVLLAIAIVAVVARVWALQPVSEDYRAVSEMMRVQRAWWAAGLSDRVDREHLQDADRDLSRVRDAAKSILSWLLMRRGWLPERDKNWTLVRGHSPEVRHIHTSHKPPADWIGGQIHYFKKNAPLREDKVRVSEAASWSLFIASGWIAAILCAWLSLPMVYEAFRLISVRISSTEHPVIASSISCAIWLALAAITIRLRVENRYLKRSAAVAATLVAAPIAATFFAVAAVNAAVVVEYWAPGEHPGPAALKHVAERVMGVSLVILSAWAGAWRYLTERRNLEAEALEYPGARVRFERAERLLAPGSDATTGTPRDEAAARKLVLELGRLALDENETWLKSRRERPLTPVVG